MAPKPRGKKYCAYHDSWDMGHTTSECYAAATAAKNGKAPPTKEKTCRLCGEPGHLMDKCPEIASCTDREHDGSSKKRRMCMNCGSDECGAKAPNQCRYKPTAWRINTNTKKFFNALREGEPFQPLHPPLSSLREGQTPLPIHHYQEARPPPPTPPKTTPKFWTLHVAGCTWDEEKLKHIATITKGKADMTIDDADKNLTLQCPSESDAQELMSMFSKATFTNGKKLTVTREEPVATTTPTTTPTPPNAGITSIQVTEIVDKRMDLMLTKHTKAINDNFTVLHKSIEKLSDRQDVTEKRQEQQDTLIAGLFDQLKTWRETPNSQSPCATSSSSPPLSIPTTPHMSIIRERTPATSDLQPGSIESPMNVDAPDTPKNPIPTPPPDPPTIALQRALRKSPTECNAKQTKYTPGLTAKTAVRNAIHKRQQPGRKAKAVRTPVITQPEDLSTPVKAAIGIATTKPTPTETPPSADDDPVVQTLDALLAVAATPSPAHAPSTTVASPPPLAGFIPESPSALSTPTIALGDHVYCIDATQPMKPFSKMQVMHIVDNGPCPGFFVRNEVPGATPTFIPNYLVASTLDRAEQLQRSLSLSDTQSTQATPTP